MKLVVFGLTISSSWGNGHATLWRGLCKSLAKRGHEVVFFEKDAPWYSSARDYTELPGRGRLIVYEAWENLPAADVRRTLDDADVAMVTSFCPDGIAATDLVCASKAGLKVFYDLDSPVTLDLLRSGAAASWVGPRGYRDFDLVLSYTGGRTLDELRRLLGARHVAPLYGSVDPDIHQPVPADERFRADLSYLGTWSADRSAALNVRFVEAAARLPGSKFILGGSKYESDFPWLPNMFFVSHLPPAQHAAFFCSSGLTLNVTRGPMAAMGYCPSGRLFEAAACGVPVLSDRWEGLESFYEPGAEILVCDTTAEAVDYIQSPSGWLTHVGRNARERTLACHTADIRAAELEHLIEDAAGTPAHPFEAELTCGV
ncbi:MAG TPA: glycosyltransferase [Bryobacteraceae bacterium]|jgi:spore maturation protein CgeB|nr:glycosyltransferase [Bryobacteraceae bacterium]